MSKATRNNVSRDELLLLQHLMEYNRNFHFSDVISSYASKEPNQRKLQLLLLQLFEMKMIVFDKVPFNSHFISYRVAAAAVQVLNNYSLLLRVKLSAPPKAIPKERDTNLLLF
jgi:hypothetical protein